jgi:enoyl-CoA hydratase/carnithine racemase
MGNFITTEIEETPRGNIARVTIDNQRKLNTLNSTAIRELSATFSRIDKDQSVAVVVLTGAGDKAFVGGADITEMAALDPTSARTFISNLHHACHKARYLRVPVIARINGIALGAGMELAAACDMVVASESAGFAMPEVRVGIPSVIDAALLPRILGTNLARDLVLTARTLSASEAHACGLVQRLAAEGKLDEAVDTVIEEILASGRQAIEIQKRLCNDWDNNTLADGIQLGIEAFAQSYESDEPKTMMNEFINRKR